MRSAPRKQWAAFSLAGISVLTNLHSENAKPKLNLQFWRPFSRPKSNKVGSNQPVDGYEYSNDEDDMPFGSARGHNRGYRIFDLAGKGYCVLWHKAQGVSLQADKNINRR